MSRKNLLKEEHLLAMFGDPKNKDILQSFLQFVLELPEEEYEGLEAEIISQSVEGDRLLKVTTACGTEICIKILHAREDMSN